MMKNNEVKDYSCHGIAMVDAIACHKGGSAPAAKANNVGGGDEEERITFFLWK